VKRKRNRVKEKKTQWQPLFSYNRRYLIDYCAWLYSAQQRSARLFFNIGMLDYLAHGTMHYVLIELSIDYNDYQDMGIVLLRLRLHMPLRFQSFLSVNEDI